MKKSFTLFIIACLLGMANLQAQVATLEHQGTSTAYYGTNSFLDAYNASVDGDAIILSSGAYSTYDGNTYYGYLTITKAIQIIGTGHYNDSVYSTTFIDHLFLGNGASNITIEGVKINYFQNFGSVSNLALRRCYFANVLYLGGGTLNNFLIEGSVFPGINFNNPNTSSNIVIRNNIIFGGLAFISGSGIIENNILTLTSSCGSYLFSNINGVLIRNNAIWCYSNLNQCGYQGGLCAGCNGNTTENNFYDITGGVSYNFDPNTNTVNNNYSGSITTLYPSGLGATFDYNTDYHIQNPTQYIGTDGTQIGIYGGSTPYKENAVPSNPRIVHKFIAPQGDADGNLQINIKVKAQNY